MVFFFGSSITKIWAVIQEVEDFTWWVSDCKELVGVSHRRRYVLPCGHGVENPTLIRRIVSAGVTAVKDDPLSVDLTIFPL